MSSIRTRFPAVCAAALLALAGATHAAETETVDLPAGIIAKMARITSKQSVDRGGSEHQSAGDRLRAANSGGGNGSPACGSLNVGNVNTGGRLGTPLREVVVVIKGDVINANNKCR